MHFLSVLTDDVSFCNKISENIKITHKIIIIIILLSIICVPLSFAATVVGSVDGQFKVNKNGAATYNVPIKVAPGVNGHQPSLSIKYNSQSGNGLLGIGWSLKGFSTIQRCSRTIAQDGVNGGVNYDANDRFCFDGKRLINISGTYGGNGTEYRTEIDSFAKVISHGGSVSSGPTWFEVKTKSGKILQLGNSTDSRISADGVSVTRLWAVNKKIDTHGNEIIYRYDSNLARTSRSGSSALVGIYPLSIQYANNSITFEYEDREDKIVMYEAGGRIEGNKKLSKVNIYGNSSKIKEYSLGYMSSEAPEQSLLNTITECNEGGKCLPSIIFGWKTNESSLFIDPELKLPNFGYNAGWKLDKLLRIMADVNGDGKADIVGFGSPGVYVSFSTGTGFTKPELKLSKFGYNAGWKLDKLLRIMADVNGDGKADIVGFGSLGVYVSFSTGTGFTNPELKLSKFGYNAGWKLDKLLRIMADVNGDGKADIVGFGSLGVYVSFSTGTGFTNPELKLSKFGYNAGWKLDKLLRIMADVNGDGKADIVGFGSPGVYVSFSTGIGFTNPELKLSNFGYNAGWKLDKLLRIMADVNGDGKADIVGFGSLGVYVSFSTGTGFTNPELKLSNFGYNAGWRLDKHLRIMSDVNGDGKADIVGFGSLGVYVSFSTGTGFTNPELKLSKFGYNAGWKLDKLLRIMTDVNGDGKADIVGFGSPGVHVSFSNSLSKQITSIHNSLSGKIDVTYKPLTDNSIYTKSSNAIYPQRDIQSSIYVVSSTERSDGVGGKRTLKYHYSGAKIDLKGRGWLGFKTVKVEDTKTKLDTIDYYHQNFPYIGKLHVRYKQYNGQNLEVRTNYYTYKNNPDSSKVKIPHIYKQYDKIYELDSSLVSNKITESIIDDFGNSTSMTINTTGSGVTNRTVTTNTYINNESSWQLGLLETSEVTITGTDGGISTKNIANTYASNGKLETKTVEPSSSNALKTIYSYDSNGNVIAISAEGNGKSRTVTTTYSGGKYPEITTNGLDHSEIKQFYKDTGLLKSLTGPNGLTTSWTYDGFGRKKAEYRTDGTSTLYSYNWCSSGCSYYATVQSTGMPISKIYYDKFNREIEKRISTFDGKIVVSKKEYNNLGQVKRVSNNYFTGGSPVWTTYVYDEIGRLKNVVDPDGNVTTTTYNGLTVSVRNAKGQVMETTKDHFGNVMEVIDSAGNLMTYEYDGFGNPKKIIDVAGNISTMKYDNLGCKTELNDPDTGNSEYKCNAFGELVWQKNVSGQVSTFNFDKLGRIKNRVEPEGTTTWEYDNAAGLGIGQLAKVSHSNGFIEEYSYDDKGLMEQTDTTIEGNTYISSIVNGINGRVESKIYPDGLKLNYLYDNIGYNTAVTNDNGSQAYWELDDINADGQITFEKYGNGAITQRNYKSTNGLLESITTTANILVQNKVFNYDSIGNMLSRKDTVISLEENFTYDNLNRLTQASITGGETLNYQYDAMGNIISKTDVGTYTYGENDAGPHAVTKVTTPNTGDILYTYDTRGNQISGDGRTISYTSFNKPSEITNGMVSTSFDYDANYSRYKQSKIDYVNSNATTLTFYLGDYEIEKSEGLTKECHYISAGGKRIAINIIETPDNASITPTTNVHYLHTDHLGSTDVITDESGNVVERSNFDPFGLARNTDFSGNQEDLFELATITRGFTGHEHLSGLNVIHMNGRIYDPVLGRFLSADPYIQAPYFSQSFNRYSYVFNNPLVYTDPSGYWGWNDLKKEWNNFQDSFNNVIKNINRELGDFFNRNHINIETSYEGTVDDEGGYSHGGGGRPDSERYDTSPGGSGGYGSGISLTLSIGFVLYEGNYYDGSSTYSYGDNVDPYDGRSNYSANGLGTKYGESSAQYYANVTVDPNTSVLAKAGAWSGGLASSLWTPDTYLDTGLALLPLGAIGKWAGRPFYMYYTKGTVYTGKWMTRGFGWKAPFKIGNEARKALCLPPYNEATAVQKYIPKWFEPIIGPRKPRSQQQWGWLKKGVREYYKGWRFPD